MGNKTKVMGSFIKAVQSIIKNQPQSTQTKTTSQDDGQIDAADYADRGNLFGVGTGSDSISFETTQIEALKPGFSFNLDQSRWIQLLVLPYQRKILQTPQVLFETIHFYADLAVMIDGYLTAQHRSLSQLRHQLNQTDNHYNNILYTLECIAEYYVGLHYCQRQRLEIDFSWELLKKHLGSTVVKMIKDWSLDRQKQINPPDNDTKTKLGLNDRGLYPFWWDESGEFRTKNQIKGRHLFLLTSLTRRSTGRLFQRQRVKTATIKIYLASVDQLLRSPLKQTPFLVELAKKLTEADNQHYLVVEKTEAESRVLGGIFALVEDCVRLACGYRTTKATTKARWLVADHLGDNLLHQLEDHLAQYQTSSLLYQLNPNNKNQEMKELKKIIKQNQLQDALKKVNQIIANWQDSDFLREIYCQLAQIFAPISPFTALFYYYKYQQAPTNLPLNERLADSTRDQVIKLLTSSSQRRRYNLLLQSNQNDKQVIKSLVAIFQKKVTINPVKQRQIQADHSRSSQILIEFMSPELNPPVEKIDPNQAQKDESLADIFADDEPQQLVKFNNQQIQLIKLFLINNNLLKRDQLLDFSRRQQILPQALVEKINQISYDNYGSQLINQQGTHYRLNRHLLTRIKELIQSSEN